MFDLFVVRAAMNLTLLAVAAMSLTVRGLDRRSTRLLVGPQRCELRRDDSTYLYRGPVYRDCAVDRKARRVGRGISLDWPSASSRTGGCYSAELEFVVDPTGTPETDSVRVVRTNDRSLAQAMRDVLPTWRYEPAQLGGVAVRQIVREKYAVMTRVVVTRDGSPPSRSAPPLSPRC